MTDDLSRDQRKLFMAAAKAQKADQGERRRRSKPLAMPRPERLYCPREYAVLDDEGRCPKCERGEVFFEFFCRRCLTVHQQLAKCVAWTPSPDTYRA